MQAPLPSQHNQPVEQPSSEVQSLGDSVFQRQDMSDGIKTAALRYRINKVIEQNEAAGATTSVNVFDLRSSRSIVAHNDTQVHFAASVNKVPIAWLVLQDLRTGALTMDDTITWLPEDVRAGYGKYDQAGAPTSATVRELLFDMLNYSGNTAVRAFVNYRLGGAIEANNRLAQYPEIPTTRLQPLDGNRFYLGNSNSKEALWILEEVLDPARNDRFQRFIKDALKTNIFSYYGVRSQLEGNDYIVLANKVGILDDVDGNNRHDVGIIYNTRTHKAYGYSFLTTTPFNNVAGTAQAEHSLDLMGRDLLRYSGDKTAYDKNREQQVKPFSAVPELAPEKKVLY